MSKSKQPLSDVEILSHAKSGLNKTRPYGDRAVVLAQTDESDLFKATPTVVLCPDCGDVVATYEQGIPEIIPIFDVSCPYCKVDLKRWCAVAVNAACKDIVEPQVLRKMVQGYWNEQLWEGVTNNRQRVRNDEYARRIGSKVSEFGWEHKINCPLCRQDIARVSRSTSGVPSDLDYHHWSEYPDRGVTLCRDCHDVIGFDKRDYNVEKLAQDWGLRSRNDLQVIRLALRDALVTNQSLRSDMSEYLVNRYNLTQSPREVSVLIESVLKDKHLRDRFVDDSLWKGLE